MNIIEVVKQAFSSLAANKLRSALTLLAIVVGVFAIISASTAVLVLDTFFKETLTLMGGNVINISKYPSVRMGGDWQQYRNRKDITFETLEELQERVRLVSDINPDETFSQTNVLYGDQETEPNVPIRGSNQYYLSNNAYELADGRNFTSEDIQYRRPVAIIGKDVRETLFEVEYPLGKTIRIDGRPYRVIGLVEEKGSVFGNSLDNFVLIPYTTAMNVYGSERNIDIQVRAPSMMSVNASMDELTGLLRTIRKVPPGEQNDFEIETNESLSGAFDQFTGVLYIFGVVVGGIALLGAGIGVMNIMLVSVTERTREIGIRKAVGATKKAITSQFLMEAVVICQIGGIVGMFIGIAGGNLLAFWMESSVVFPWMAAGAGIVGMTIIGVMFGVYPAFKAAKLDPIESLRYE
ncbi:ABC transporter permease [Halalkalibaculum sp. DA3122]|uniref:ABC transporter permease n=1 Tax=Halalkalibaculum sp. DA3122 TaxID=3373607 RepID=UPI003753F7F1